MGSFSIITNARTNNPPIQLGDQEISVLNRDSYTIQGTDFINTIPEYIDPEGDLPDLIKITELTSITGTLEYNSVAVTLNQEIPYSGIQSGLFEYTANNTDSAYVDSFKFDIQDVGSGVFANLEGVFKFNVLAYVNQPPSSVGDNSDTMDHGDVKVFTRADFTTGTTPAYVDPEGDAAGKLKITSLPNQGELQLNSVVVTLNQVIDFSDIDSGNFTYVANGIYSGYTTSFDYSIADVGSNIFTS